MLLYLYCICKIAVVHFPEVAEQYGLVSLCKDFIDRGSPKQAKHAIRCLYINFGKPGESQFSEILEVSNFYFNIFFI